MIRPPGSSERPDQPLAVVVGAGALGSAIARRFGPDFRLLIADRDEVRLAALVSTLKAEGHDARGHVCDITDPASVAELARASTGWRALAHVAALSPSMGDFCKILSVNLTGTLLVEQAFRETATPGAAAVFISSMGAYAALPPPEVLALFDAGLQPDLPEKVKALTEEPTSRRAYQLSKIAMNRMCRRQAVAWGRMGARIVSLSPGLIATPMGALEFKGTVGKMELYQKSPLEREGTMLEVTAMAAFLVSPAASFVSGTDILVDGGLTAALAFPGN